MTTTQTLPFLGARRIRKGFTFSPAALAHLDQQGAQAQEIMGNLYDSAVHWYKMGGFEIVNRYLRGEGVEPRMKSFWKQDEWNALAEKNIAVIDEAIAKSEADATHGHDVLYRLVALSERMNGGEHPHRHHATDATTLEDFLKKYEVGSEFTEKAYISTTVDSDFIVKKARETDFTATNVVFEIVSERGAVVHEQSDGGYCVQDEEREVLLPRGMKFRVHAIHRDVTFQTDETVVHGSRLYPISLANKEKRVKATVIQVIAV